MLSYENSFPSQQTKNIISRKEEKSKSPITPERRGHRRDKRREENNAGAILVTRECSKERTPRSHVPGLFSSASEYSFPFTKLDGNVDLILSIIFDIFQLGVHVQCKFNNSTFSYLPICEEWGKFCKESTSSLIKIDPGPDLSWISPNYPPRCGSDYECQLTPLYSGNWLSSYIIASCWKVSQEVSVARWKSTWLAAEGLLVLIPPPPRTFLQCSNLMSFM